MNGNFNIIYVLLCMAIGYIAGNFQTAVIVSRVRFQEDVRDYGSGNPGSTNMYRVYGGVPALITFLGDSLKAILAVLIGRLLMDPAGGYIAGLFAVVGHLWPVFARFKGGKGVACSMAIGLMFYPAGMLISLAAAIAVYFIFERVSLSSLTWCVVFLIFVVIFKRWDTVLLIVTILDCLLVAFAHRENIRRLLHKEEPKTPLKLGIKIKKRRKR